MRGLAAGVSCCALFLAVAAVAAAPAAGATAPDPVVKAIDAAAATGGISGAERREYLGVWRSSAATARHLAKRQPRRAGEIDAARAIAVGMARRSRLGGDRLPTVMASLHATTWWFGTHAVPNPEQRIVVPFDQVVFGYYPGVGLQFQPLFTMVYGNSLYDSKQNDKLLALVQRLDRLAVDRGGYRAWEYDFPYAGGKPPWVSAMAQATALQVLSHAAERTGDTHWMDLAAQALPGFAMSAAAGGLSSPEGSGRWYLLYAFNPGQRILNGDLQSLIGLGDYAKASGSADAQARFDEGVNAVVPLLPRFDSGAWSYYQPGQEADLNYHELMSLQLTKLGQRTGRTEFTNLANRFLDYESTPPQLTTPPQAIPDMYPFAHDGFRDTTPLRYFTDKRASVTASIVDQAGSVVRRIGGSGGARGVHVVTWDGRTTSGAFAPAGTYSVRFSAIDIVGNQSSGQFAQQIVTRRDTTPPVVAKVLVKAAGPNSTRVVIWASDTESPYLAVRVQAKGVVVQGRGNHKIVLTVPVARGSLVTGSVIVADTSGNRVRVRL